MPNNFVLMSYLSGIYLKRWFSWLEGRMQKTKKTKKKKIKRRKTLKNKEKEKRRIQGTSNNNNKHLCSIFYIKNYVLLENIV